MQSRNMAVAVLAETSENSSRRCSSIRTDRSSSTCVRDYSVAHLHPYVNMRTLIGHHLGLRGYSR